MVNNKARLRRRREKSQLFSIMEAFQLRKHTRHLIVSSLRNFVHHVPQLYCWVKDGNLLICGTDDKLLSFALRIDCINPHTCSFSIYTDDFLNTLNQMTEEFERFTTFFITDRALWWQSSKTGLLIGR